MKWLRIKTYGWCKELIELRLLPTDWGDLRCLLKNLSHVDNAKCTVHREQGLINSSTSSTHRELRFVTKMKNNKTQQTRKIKELWGLERVRRCASPLNLQLGSGPVQLTLISIVKKTRHKLLKNSRTSVLKTHSHFTHTYLGCLPHLLLSDSLIWYWNIEQIIGRFFSIQLEPFISLLSLSSSFLSFLFCSFSPPSVGW